jgi:hypothetical protein
MANGEETQITHEVTEVTLSIQKHQEKIAFDVFGLATHDIILGLPWLRKHNPRVDWIRERFRLSVVDWTQPQVRLRIVLTRW